MSLRPFVLEVHYTTAEVYRPGVIHANTIEDAMEIAKIKFHEKHTNKCTLRDVREPKKLNPGLEVFNPEPFEI